MGFDILNDKRAENEMEDEVKQVDTTVDAAFDPEMRTDTPFSAVTDGNVENAIDESLDGKE